MYYRVVIQGRTLGGADVAEVKRQFVRVTGLPARVAEQLFGGMPQVIKRRVPQTDAERIAATLRAIGAAATVEREPPGTEDETPEGIQVVVATPLNTGPPTIIPGSAAAPEVTPPSRQARLSRAMRGKGLLLAGGAVVVVAGAILLAPVVDDLVANIRRAPAPARAVPTTAPAPEIADAAPALNVTLLHGPWRCVNQRTGLSSYWTYGEDGALILHGDVLSDRPPKGTGGPTGWKLDGHRLSHTFGQDPPSIYTVSELTLARLRYSGARDLTIECRRP